MGHALGKRKRERMRETKVANYEWPMNISPCESTKSRERASELKAEKLREKELKAVAFHPAVLALG